MSSPNCDSYILKIEAKALRKLKASREITARKAKMAADRLESLRNHVYDTDMFDRFIKIGFKVEDAFELTQAACTTTI